MTRAPRLLLAKLSAVLLAMLAGPAAVEAGEILPTRITITGPNGETYFTVPLRVYLEYGHGTAQSKPNPAGTVDIRRDRVTLGADFVTSTLWFWGVNLQYANVEDRGTAPGVFSLNTDKDIVGGQFYLARYILPRVVAGISTSYHRADGRSVYNLVVVNNERSDYYSFTPFVQKEHPLSRTTRLTYGAAVDFSYGSFNYDINIPPSASTRQTALRLPVGIEHNLTRNLIISGSARWNQILSIETFGNMPGPDRSTMTLTVGSRYTFVNGVSLYGNLSHDVFDSAYDSTRFTIGISSPLSQLQPDAPLRNRPNIIR